MEGQTVGKYELISRVAEGGMGVFYRALDTRLDRTVGIKTLHTEFSVDEQLRARFTNEARALAKLNHPNICILYDFFEESEQLFIVMEYIEGETLADIVRRKGALETEKVMGVFRQILMALDYAHGKHVVHRDIKPSNIMISTQGMVKVMDFGIAKIVGASKQLTKTGRKVGSIPYMSPEQITEKTIDHRSDIYSLGVTLFQVCTGKVPFDATSDFEVMKQHLEMEPPSPRSLESSIPGHIERVILKAIAKKPEDRYQKAGEMRQALTTGKATQRDLVPELVSNEGSVSTREVSALARPSHAGRKALLWGTVLLIVAALGLTGWYRRQHVQDPIGARPFIPLTVDTGRVDPPLLAEVPGGATGYDPLEPAAPSVAEETMYAGDVEPGGDSTGGNVSATDGRDSSVAAATDTAVTETESGEEAGVPPTEVLAQVVDPEPVPEPEPVVYDIPDRYFIQVRVEPAGRFRIDDHGWWKRNGRILEGRHSIEAMGAGYPIYRDDFYLLGDTAFTVDLEGWSANFARADLRASARTVDDDFPRCEVYINGALAGHVPGFRQELRAGAYEIELVPADGYRVDSLKYVDEVFGGDRARIRVRPNRRTFARFYLSPL